MLEKSKEYTLDGLLQKGGFGSVFAATRVSDGSPVAVKQIPRAKVQEYELSDDEIVPLEISLLKRVGRVPGVIRMFDYFYEEREDVFVIVMERPERMTDLFEFQQRCRYLDEDVSRILFRRVLMAVMGCHRVGVLHRDLKDENVLVDPDTLEVRLIDFGCGTHLVEDRPYERMGGTYHICPPEWFTSRSYGGVEATVWSLGILLFTMVCGDCPFEYESEIVEARIRFRRGDLTRECKNLIRKCLSVCARERPSLEQILRDPWLDLF